MSVAYQIRVPEAAIAVFVTIMTLVAFGGCGERSHPPLPMDDEPGGATPEHAVRKLMAGVLESRDDLIEAAIDQTVAEGNAYTRVLQRMARTFASYERAGDAAREKFGEQGVEVFYERAGIMLTWPVADLDWDEVRIETDGNRAIVAAFPDEEPLHLHRRQDRWFIIPPEDYRDRHEQLEDDLARVSRLATHQMRRFRAALSEADTVDDLRQALEASNEHPAAPDNRASEPAP